ncbi:heterokaryon incompatibility protein-domain-containing protein [Xylariaceae sp. FL1019]|nr:heterokaryon incompatibility protein-domain-containing protein [Xylariaceae sp. FL1019]
MRQASSKSLDLASTNSEQNISRSLSQRAKNLGRRVSFITKSNPSRCIDCHDVDFAQLSQKPINFQHNPDGIFLGWLPDGPPAGKCGLCQTLSQVRIQQSDANASSEQLTGARLQVRAFPLLPHVSELFEQGSGSQLIPSNGSNADIFIAVVPNHFTLLPGSRNEVLLKTLVARLGFLVYTDRSTSPSRLLSPHLVPPNFSPHTVKNWVSTCQGSHPACRSERRREPSLNLLDCKTKTIITASDRDERSCPEYVALSYVWGNAADQRKVVLDKHKLPASLPQVIQDSIEATLKLGYHYLWVDKYCVDANDKLRKHEQLMHMDSVYQNATLTLVAAAGFDESYGLPGLSRTREAQQTLFDCEDFSLTSILPLPHDSITQSRWASRGWTYQEAILSRRRLVFTDTQLYFQCNSLSCCESFDVSQGDKVRMSGSNSLSFAQPSLFALKQLPSASTSIKAARLSNFFTYVNCTEEYSRRALSYDHNSLTAFSGIIRMLESFTAYPVRHIWGIPFFGKNIGAATASFVEALHS